MRSQPTPREQDVLDALRRHLRAHRIPPTRAELCRLLGLASRNTVLTHLRVLERKGYVRLVSKEARGIELLNSARDEETLPLLGRVPAGHPLDSVEILEDHPGIRELFPEADFLLRVHGNSMIGANICDGDIVAFKQVSEADHGRIIIALLNGEQTLKRLHYRDGRLLLVAENPDMQPIVVDPQCDDFAIEGLYVGHAHVACA